MNLEALIILPDYFWYSFSCSNNLLNIRTISGNAVGIVVLKSGQFCEDPFLFPPPIKDNE